MQGAACDASAKPKTRFTTGRIEPDKTKVSSMQVPAVPVAGLAENADCSQPIRRSTSHGRL
jgi:hypothetical protein